jgi:hypothetical protein
LWSANGTYAFSRSLDSETFVVAFNVSDSQQQAMVAYDGQDPQVVFGEASELTASDGHLKFSIPARCGVLLK